MVEPNDAIAYLPMSLARHNIKDVADLIYESAPQLFTVMFGSRAVDCLMALLQRSQNRFSYQYIHIAERNQQVVGIATLVPTANLKQKADYLDVLTRPQQIWLNLVRRLILRRVLQHDFPIGSFYIGNLAVAAKYRNQGIGRQLLLQCITAATIAANAPTTLFMSVDVQNGRAQRLYESLGFQVVATKAIRFLGIPIGSRLLSRSIADEARQHQHDTRC